MTLLTNGTSGGSGLSSEINVTPLIDVLLVMLIIFMVIVPAMPGGLLAALPSVATEGRANEALCEFLAGQLDLPVRAIEIIGGLQSRDKLVAITGLDSDAARLRLLGEK